MTSKTKTEVKPDAPPDEPGADDGTLKFEVAVERLEAIVRRMEEEQLPLDDLIRDYEQGTRLLRVCRERIDGARARIERIGRTADGGLGLEGFESASGDEASGAGDHPAP